MYEPRYYFSTDGSNKYGPLTVAALRRLFSDGAIGASSFLRGEDESEWRRLNPAFFAPTAEPGTETPSPIAISLRPESIAPPVELPATEPRVHVGEASPPPEPAAHVAESPAVETPVEVAEAPPSEPAARATASPGAEPANPIVVSPSVEPPPPPIGTPQLTSPPKEPREVSMFSIAAVVLGFAVALWLTERTAAPRDYLHNGSSAIGGFIGRILFLVLLPRLIAYPFARRLRPVVFLVGVLGFSLLVFLGQSKEAVDTARIADAAQSLQETTKTEAQKQLKDKGYFEQDPADAARAVEKLKDQVGSGDSDTARMSRAFLVVVSELLEKTKHCDELGKACDFDALTITGLDDIAQRKAAIERLHLAQEDVVNYLQNIDGRCREILSKDNFSEYTIEQAIAGFRQSGHIDPIIALWQAQAQLSVDHIARLDFLAKGWGTWSVKDGQLLFPDDISLNAYDGYVHAIQADVTTIGNAQKQIYK